MPTEIDWLDELAAETGIGYGPVLEILGAIVLAMEAGDATDDGIEYAGFNGEIKGLTFALKALDAKSGTIVEAIKQIRKERNTP